jgi:hypothetical protein
MDRYEETLIRRDIIKGHEAITATKKLNELNAEDSEDQEIIELNEKLDRGEITDDDIIALENQVAELRIQQKNNPEQLNNNDKIRGLNGIINAYHNLQKNSVKN